MRARAPFQPEDLQELDERVLSRAEAVVSLREVYEGNRSPGAIQMRHDVDNASCAWPTAIKLAEWEAARGYRSTYYLLHTARYWFAEGFVNGVEFIQACGHEVGIHLDAVGEWAETGENPHDILRRALIDLRCVADVRSAVGHGNRNLLGTGLTNDSQIMEFARERSSVERFTRSTGVAPLPLAEFGLHFEAVLLGRTFQLTDSGGGWVGDFDKLAARFAARKGQMHMNVHPDHWGEAV